MKEDIEYGDNVTIEVTFNKGSHNSLRESFIRNIKQWLHKLTYLGFSVKYTKKENKEETFDENLD